MTESALDRARNEIREVLGWLAAGLTVWIDRATDPHEPKGEVLLSMLRQGEAAIARLEAAAREEGREDALLTKGEWIARGKVNEMIATARLEGERLGNSLCELLGRYAQEGDGGMVGTLTRILAERDRLRTEAEKP